MALVSPNYVQGNYSVAERDAIFDKAKLYPDPAGALQNQVPMIMPGGSIGWRQISAGGETGTANANIAVVEPTQYASKDYKTGELLVYDGQLYWALSDILAGDELIPADVAGQNIQPARVDLEAVNVIGKGRNLFRNWYFAGVGSPYPINQRGALSYSNAGGTIDGWNITAGTLTLGNSYITFAAPANNDAEFYQIIETPLATSPFFAAFPFSFSVMTISGLLSGVGDASGPALFENDRCRLTLQSVDATHLRANIHVFAGKALYMYAAKLEYGIYQTLAKTGANTVFLLDAPPDYGEELAKCQRHQVVFVTGSGNDALIGYGYCYNATTYIFSLPTPVTMARRPANPIQCGGAYCTAHGADLPITALNAYWSANVNSINLVATVADGGVAGESAILKLSSGWMILDADAEDSRNAAQGGETR